MLHFVCIHGSAYRYVYSFFPVRSSMCNVDKACIALRIQLVGLPVQLCLKLR
uniref:Uncharacterized protein n=1 Tax=Arundo donax TaxID=35708 RepID=A0A0A8ZRE8_ARUDO